MAGEVGKDLGAEERQRFTISDLAEALTGSSHALGVFGAVWR